MSQIYKIPFSTLSTFQDTASSLGALALTLPPVLPLRDRSGKSDDGTAQPHNVGMGRELQVVW